MEDKRLSVCRLLYTRDISSMSKARLSSKGVNLNNEKTNLTVGQHPSLSMKYDEIQTELLL